MQGSKPNAERQDDSSKSCAADPISLGLQHLFQSVVDEPIPDEFMALLDKIDSAASAKHTGNTPASEPESGPESGPETGPETGRETGQ